MLEEIHTENSNIIEDEVNQFELHNLGNENFSMDDTQHDDSNGPSPFKFIVFDENESE